MNMSALFIKRPVTTTLLMLGILVFGGLAYQVLPVADLPSVDFPSIRVQASLPGASPETMAASVALPLEKQFTSIAGVTSINSTSTQGGTDITIQFDINKNIDAAAQDVQSMIGRASRQLPPEMPSPPSYQKVNPADQSIFFIVLRSSTLSLAVLDEIAQSQVAQRISMVSGVAQVNIFGSQKFAVRVDVDPRHGGDIGPAVRVALRDQREPAEFRFAPSTLGALARPVALWTRASWRRARSASTRWPTPSTTRTRICRRAQSTVSARSLSGPMGS